jgi:mannose-6-phosphate isomerase-like protein (cupin superfamily)
MKVVHMREPQGDALTEALLQLRTDGASRLEIGSALLRAGARVPAEGESRHAGIEISYVVRGIVDVVNAAGTTRIGPGDLVVVPAEEWHYSHVIEEAALVYTFVLDAEPAN